VSEGGGHTGGGGTQEEEGTGEKGEAREGRMERGDGRTGMGVREFSLTVTTTADTKAAEKGKEKTERRMKAKE
jgi:hypothetical protein